MKCSLTPRSRQKCGVLRWRPCRVQHPTPSHSPSSLCKVQVTNLVQRQFCFLFLKNKNNVIPLPCSFSSKRRERTPVPRRLPGQRLIICVLGLEHQVNIHVAAPLPRGLSAGAGAGGWHLAVESSPSAAAAGLAVLSTGSVSLQSLENVPKGGDHPGAHTEAMTIMRWGEMLEMLARRSGASRER